MSKLIVQVLYDSGLRLREGLNLRVKDSDFAHHQIIGHDTKGRESRVTLLTDGLIEALTQHLQQLKCWHQMDLNQDALARRYVNSNRQWVWQFVFPAKSRYRDENGDQMLRPHLHPSGVQKALKQAVGAAGIEKRVSCHPFRHSFATHLLQNGGDFEETLIFQACCTGCCP